MSDRMDKDPIGLGVPEPLELRSLILRTIMVACAALGLYMLVFALVRAEIASIGVWFGRELGLWGVFWYTYLVDTLIVPATADVLFTVTHDWPPLPLLTVISTASILGGWTGFWIGRKLNRFRFVEHLTSNYRARGEQLIRRYGVWAIVIAGFTPVPYSTVSWIAGMLKMRSKTYLVGSLSRIPRLVLYFLVIREGFSLLRPWLPVD